MSEEGVDSGQAEPVEEPGLQASEAAEEQSAQAQSEPSPPAAETGEEGSADADADSKTPSGPKLVSDPQVGEKVPEPEPPEDKRSQAEVSADYVTRKRTPDAEHIDDDGESLDQAAEARRVNQQEFAYVTKGLRNNGIFTHGDNALAVQQQVFISSGGQQITILRSCYDPGVIRTYRETYVKVSQFQAISQTLGARRVVVLRGNEGTGRRTTAINALAACGATAVEVLDLESNVGLRAIHSTELFSTGHGYILEYGQRLVQDTLESFATLAKESDAYLVIVTDALAPAGRLDLSFQHSAPPVEDVLLKHLNARLLEHECESCTAESLEEYANQRLSEIRELTDYHLPAQMYEIVHLAEVIAENVHTGAPTAKLVQRDPVNLRRVAAEAMRTAPDKPELTDQAVRWQSFRVAYSVFDGFPLTDVFEAGELLSREVVPLFEKRGTPPDHVVFEGKVADLLLADMYVEESVDQLTGQFDTPRRARLIDRALIPMVLDVVWNEFDATRMPLLTWLDLLVGMPTVPQKMKVRAAQAAGILATLDWDEIYRSLIRLWAQRSQVYRQSAASALELAACDERFTRRVKRQVADWARSPNPSLQDSAVRALSSRIGASEPARTIETFHSLASKPDLARSNSLAIGMAYLFAIGAADLVLNELTRWANDDNVHLRRHGVRVLLLLSRMATVDESGTRLSVPQLVANREPRMEALARLWRDALVGPDTASRAWEPLRRWMTGADGDAELENFVAALACQIFAGARHDRRAVFHLKLWRARHPDSHVIQRVHDAVVAAAESR